jgi:hypothetical protein
MPGTVGLGGRGTSPGQRAEASRARGGQASESGRRVGRPGVGGQASGIWGRGIEGGGGGTEVGGGVEGGDTEVGSGVEGGGAEVGQPDGTKPNFTVIRVSRRRGYSPYTWYIFGIG